MGIWRVRLLYFIKRILIVGSIFLLLLMIWFGYFKLLISNPDFKSEKSHFLSLGQRSLIGWNQLNDQVLLESKETNKLLFFVIGKELDSYATQFVQTINRSPLIAKLLNRSYIPVLIDFDLSPYFSQQLIEIMAYQIQSFQFPLVIVTTPDGIPLFFGSFNSLSNLLTPLTLLQSDWSKAATKTQMDATQYASNYRLFLNKQAKQDLITTLNVDYFKSLTNKTHGGFNMGTNFLYFRHFNLLLNIFPSLLDQAEYTFENIVTSPTFDFVEGGVFKASFTSDWSQPIPEKQFIDQVHFLEFLLNLYQLSNNALFLDYLNFNLNFIATHFKTTDGAYLKSIVDKASGQYFSYSKDILDAYAPVDFKRVDFMDDADLVAMVYSSDLLRVSRSQLKNLRLNKKDTRLISQQVLIRENAYFLVILNQLAKVKGLNGPESLINDLLTHIRSISYEDLTIEDQLILMDSFLILGLEQDAKKVESFIWPKLNLDFPFSHQFSSLNQDVFGPQHIDHYQFNVTLYYLLKYKNRFFPSLRFDEMCNDIRRVVTKPFDQLSLIYIYSEVCN